MVRIFQLNNRWPGNEHRRSACASVSGANFIPLELSTSTPQLASQHRLTHLPAPTDLSPSIAGNCLHWSDFPNTSFTISVSSPSIPFPPNLQLAPYLPEWLMHPSPSQSFVNFTPRCNSLRHCLCLSQETRL